MFLPPMRGALALRQACVRRPTRGWTAMEVNRIKVWQCVGCGRIDDPQPCVGICRDEKREYVCAADHDAAMARGRSDLEVLRHVARELATVTPRAGQWEQTYRALQERA